MIDQEKLFNDNINLAYWVANKYDINNVDKEDIYQVALIGLQKAVKKYDETKCKFSVFAKIIIRNEICMEFRKVNKKIKCYSIDKDIEDGSRATFEEATPSDVDIIKDYDIKDVLKRLEKTKKGKILIDYYINDLSQKELAKKYNYNQKSICIIIKRELERIRKELEK